MLDLANVKNTKSYCHELLFSSQYQLSIVPQLSKCLNFEAVWGVLTDQMI